MIIFYFKDDDEVTFNPNRATPELKTPQSVITNAETPSSVYQPSECFTSPYGDDFEARSSSREKLNLFLASRGVSPIRYAMVTPWEEAAERTKRFHTRKARKVVIAALEEIAPHSAEMLLDCLKSSKEDEEDIDSTLMGILVECYENAGHWSTRRQLLSIMADKVSFKVVKAWIPNLSRYRYSIARQHILLHGRGATVPVSKNTRMKVLPEKLDHFLTFITSPYIMQDLPFGEKTLKLSSNTEIKIPNVVRTMIPEQIVQQYLCYCDETGFAPLSRSTLCRVLTVCSASVRKSLQGLDYVSAEGGKAFDELTVVIEKLGEDYGKGHSWAKDQSEKLKLAKRYLKGDFKVGMFKIYKFYTISSLLLNFGTNHFRTNPWTYGGGLEGMDDTVLRFLLIS